MKSRLAGRYFMIFGGLAALLCAALCLLLFWANGSMLEQNRVSSYQRAAESIGSLSDSVLRGRESADSLRFAITFAEAALDARVFAIAPSESPFTGAGTEPMLRGAEALIQAAQNGETVYVADHKYNSADHLLYAFPLSDRQGCIAIVAQRASIDAGVRETGFFFVVASLGVLLVALIAYAGASSRAAAPIAALKDAAERLKSGDDLDDIVAAQDNELGSLVSVFNSMKDTFISEENARNDFTANISHDLRTPLTSIYGFTQGILDGVIKPEEYTKTLEIVAREVRHMIRLTGDILEITKIDSGRFKLNKEYVDLPELLEEILEGLNTSYPAIRRSLSVQSSVGVMADRGRLMQVFTNLIVNALKYNFEGGEVTITVSRRAKSAEVIVADTGVGMSEQELSRVFEKFYRADKSRTSSNEGTGIGLYVVKRLLEMHGATITFSSTPGEGSKARVELPL